MVALHGRLQAIKKKRKNSVKGKFSASFSCALDVEVAFI